MIKRSQTFTSRLNSLIKKSKDDEALLTEYLTRQTEYTFSDSERGTIITDTLMNTISAYQHIPPLTYDNLMHYGLYEVSGNSAQLTQEGHSYIQFLKSLVNL